MKTVIRFFGATLPLCAVICHAQPVLTGVSLYTADASGGAQGSARWNTLGTPDLNYNLYLFTGSTASPTFLNSGNTDASLNPNLALTSGSHVIQFAGQNPVSGYMGINFYFNNSTTNAITAVVPWDESTGFSVV